jgi:hypothetical protein
VWQPSDHGGRDIISEVMFVNMMMLFSILGQCVSTQGVGISWHAWQSVLQFLSWYGIAIVMVGALLAQP